MRVRSLAILGALAMLTVGAAPADDRAAPSAPTLAAPSAQQPLVALLATHPSAENTSLYLTRGGDTSAGPPVATFHHLPFAAIRAAVLPQRGEVMVTADATLARDTSYNASLFRLTPHAPAAELCDRVAYATTPLVTAEGRVFVSRGVIGPPPSEDTSKPPGLTLREDALSIDEVDPATGSTRVVHTWSGYIAFLAGAYGGEIIVYRVGPKGADLVGIGPDSGATRSIAAKILPYARDFSIDKDRGVLVFQQRSETDSRRWGIETIDLASGSRSRLFESASMNLAPHAWPGEGVSYNPEPAEGLHLLGGTASVSAPLGGGVDVVMDVSPDGAFALALHTIASKLPAAFVVGTQTGNVARLALPPGTRATLAGFFPSSGATK